MGIFSLFGKKDQDQEPEPTAPAEKKSSRRKTDEDARRLTANTDAAIRAAIEQRKIAQATARKIDAIESEMSSEFVKSPAANTPPRTMPPSEMREKPGAKPAAVKPPPAKPKPSAATLSSPSTSGRNEAFLLGDTIGGLNSASVSVSESAPALEEAAILFANNQTDMVEQVLQGAIHDITLGHAMVVAWRMLFDLYQITGKQEAFDHLSIEYASKFETSPPAWIGTSESQAAPEPVKGAVPRVPFSGRLDGNIVKLLERAQNLAEKSEVLRLEFTGITDVDPVGCGILLSVLKKLQKSGNDLILVGALELVAKIRSILEVGRRDETEAPWLLVLEILRLLNLEQEFEEASIDYCVTFEVSPPPFVAPKNKVTTALEEASTQTSATQHFMMPAVIEGRTDTLIHAITAYAGEHSVTILDCSNLQRVDFSAAGQLLAGLAPLCGTGTTIEMHNVNHLVTVLFHTMGMADIFHISSRKN